MREAALIAAGMLLFASLMICAIHEYNKPPCVDRIAPTGTAVACDHGSRLEVTPTASICRCR